VRVVAVLFGWLELAFVVFAASTGWGPLFLAVAGPPCVALMVWGAWGVLGGVRGAKSRDRGRCGGGGGRC
jgi:hypothetical protein